ncbi:hypothetical protein F5I97DRAFT_1328741 [Phlebopus sp. FC_14]|nr:hypothetical protein F5I97DRAFT_1328741 [Phlebopus sp. FC_14]
MSQKESSFFERERDRLCTEITAVMRTLTEPVLRALTNHSTTQGFEELLSSSNVLNRKLEEVLGMTREYETIAALWKSFHELMRSHNEPLGDHNRAVPGTGAHIVSTSSSRP